MSKLHRLSSVSDFICCGNTQDSSSLTIKPTSIVIFEIKHSSVVPGGGHVLAKLEATLKSIVEMGNESDGESMNAPACCLTPAN